MDQLTVSATNDYLVRGMRPFFYLADTVWVAFANLSIEEWKRYLSFRRLQGFNALQMSILPITHDTSVSAENLDPFLRDADGNWDFSRYDERYFERAERMVELAVDAGFVPVLGVLWCNYVPATRCSAHSPEASAMPAGAVGPYAEYAARRFARFEPVFFISGDTQFESPEESRYYMTALEAVRAICPRSLITMHLTPSGDLPEEFVNAVDFYMYQSGHGAETQDLPYRLAQKFRDYPVKRPVVNAEPCYEGHGRVGSRTRFSRFDVRKALWQSLLSGAKMGIAYGGHGVWSSHQAGMKFLNRERSFEPFDREKAVHLEGAWDAGFAKWVFETHGLFDLEPVGMGEDGDPEIVVAMSADHSKVAAYSPYAFDLTSPVDLDGYRCVAIDLETRRVMAPLVEGRSIAMPQLNGDSLFLAMKEG